VKGVRGGNGRTKNDLSLVLAKQLTRHQGRRGTKGRRGKTGDLRGKECSFGLAQSSRFGGVGKEMGILRSEGERSGTTEVETNGGGGLKISNRDKGERELWEE